MKFTGFECNNEKIVHFKISAHFLENFLFNTNKDVLI